MEKIEQERQQILKQQTTQIGPRRAIIPIILRGKPQELPSKIADIQFSDFSQFFLHSDEITDKDKEFITEIYKIADQIASLDGSTFSSCSTPFVANQLKAGVRVFKVRAV